MAWLTVDGLCGDGWSRCKRVDAREGMGQVECDGRLFLARFVQVPSEGRSKARAVRASVDVADVGHMNIYQFLVGNALFGGWVSNIAPPKDETARTSLILASSTSVASASILSQHPRRLRVRARLGHSNLDSPSHHVAECEPMSVRDLVVLDWNE